MSARHAGATLLIAALAAPAAAQAQTWSEPVTIDRGRGPARVATPVVVPGANGQSTAAWVRRAPGGSALMGRVGTLRAARYMTVHSSRRRIADPALLTSTGSALFAWRWNATGDAWRIRTRAASTRTLKGGPLQTLTRATPTAGPPSFIGSTGGTRLAWQRGTSSPTVEVARPGAGGRFAGTVRYLIPGLVEADATVTARGAVVVAYTKLVEGEQEPRLTIATQGATGLRDVAAFGGRLRAEDPAVAGDRAGRIVVAGVESTGVTQRVVVATRAPGETAFTEPVALTGDDVLSRFVRVVPKSDGAVLVSWLEEDAAVSPGSPPSRIMVASLGGGARQLSRAGEGASDYAVAVDGRGNAHFVYRSGEPGLLRAVTVSDAEVVGRARRVTAAGERAGAFSVGASAGGAVAVAWTSANGREIRLAERR